MDEPSKPSPSLKTSSSNVAAGREKCCHCPGRSVNFTSTTWTPFSLISDRTLFTESARVFDPLPRVTLAGLLLAGLLGAGLLVACLLVAGLVIVVVAI